MTTRYRLIVELDVNVESTGNCDYDKEAAEELFENELTSDHRTWRKHGAKYDILSATKMEEKV